MKILSTKLHGILDYLTGILLIGLPWILGFQDVPAAMWTVIFVGAMIIVMSLFTNYETGVIRSISMSTHLNIDIVTGLLFAASPWFLGFADRVYLPHLILGLFQTTTSLLTSRKVRSYENEVTMLVISKQKCKLFRADAFGMEYVPVADLPDNLEDVKRLSEKDASTVRVGNSTAGGANFHGVGGGNPDEKTNISVYFEHVDDILFKEIFNKENVPLLLAGVEYLIPIYKSVCDYHNVCSEALTGSHEHDDKNELYQKAKTIMLPYFKQPLTKALTMYANQSATELTSSIAGDVIPAAYYGRISHIFVQKARHIWGTFDENTSEISIQNVEQPEAEDLLDQALIKTMMTGGEVFLLEQHEMPADSPVAAVFRY